jgi:hypothetical protein
MSGPRRRDFILALYPFTVGLAYVLFESPLSPVEWGVKDIRGSRKVVQAIEAAQGLIDRLQPDVLVLQDFVGPTRRSARIRRLQRLIEGHAQAQALDVHRFSRQQIRDVFRPLGATTRYEIAQVIASQIHAFRHRLPPPRKIWKTEASRMGLFDAASLALTFYAQLDRGPIPDEPP